MRIILATDTFYPGQVNGVAKLVYDSAQALTKRGHEVRVVSVASVPSLPFWGYPGERFTLPWGAAYRQIKNFKPEIIHIHTPFTIGWEALAAGKKLGVPLVGTHHTFFDHYLKHIHLDSRLTRQLSWQYLIAHYNRYQAVLSPSQALLDGLRENGLRTQTFLFPNMIDTDLFKPAGPALTPTLIYMGRLSYEKSTDQVIKAFSLINQARPDAKLLLVGDGPERAKLEALVKKLNLAKSVTFTGLLHGAALVKALQSARLFMTASASENMPLSVLEAMAAGLPIIGVRALGMPEIVTDGLTGFLTKPGDIKELATQALKILNDAKLGQQLGQAARAKALQYGQAAHAEQLEKLYESLLIS